MQLCYTAISATNILDLRIKSEDDDGWSEGNVGLPEDDDGWFEGNVGLPKDDGGRSENDVDWSTEGKLCWQQRYRPI